LGLSSRDLLWEQEVGGSNPPVLTSDLLRVRSMASPLGLVWGRRPGRIVPGRLAYRHRSQRQTPLNEPGLRLYLAIKGLYQKGFGGNWGGIAYTRSCQSASA